ncbi:hypothetical protein [Phenylobacterium sp.]|uniref:hypothetical protein n=1 Tax=Phenylobacterium sp. TaxID=1871053 RepID=UPI002ED96593
MGWRVRVEFPQEPGDVERSFTHRVGNLQEEVFSRLEKAGGGFIPLESLDRVGYGFTVTVPRNRDLKGVMKLVQKVCAAHIPERDPTLDPIEA